MTARAGNHCTAWGLGSLQTAGGSSVQVRASDTHNHVQQHSSPRGAYALLHIYNRNAMSKICEIIISLCFQASYMFEMVLP